MKLVNWTWAFTNAMMLVHNPVDWLWKRKGMEKEGMDNIDWLVYELRDNNTMVSLFHRLQDIQIRGVNRDQNKIQKANQFPNSKHFFTYRHSLRVSFRCTYAFVPVSFFYILWSSYSSCVPINICSMTEYLVHCIAFYCTVHAVTKKIGKLYMKTKSWTETSDIVL